jgi:hypothetical protein
MQDKEKLKDFDKIRLQLEQLLEFKSRIMESQTSLQREVQRAKQEAREAIEARETHAEEMADLAETVEMATLDKEMAEEKVRSLKCVCISELMINEFNSLLISLSVLLFIFCCFHILNVDIYLNDLSIFMSSLFKTYKVVSCI